MIDLFIGLVLLGLVFRLIAFIVNLIVDGVKAFWIWLGKGDKLDPNEKTGGAFSTPEDIELYNEMHKRSTDKCTRKELKAIYKAKRAMFMDNFELTFYHVVVIFFGGSVLGLLLEQVWMLVTAGLTESRVGLVWGPFSPLYGVGAVLVTICCLQMLKRGAKWWQIFLAGAILGGLLEQFTGWTMETFFHASSWSYSHLPDHITKWVAWRFLFFWGLLGIVWTYKIMPEMLYRIGLPTSVRQVMFIFLVAVYLAADISMTVICFQRKTARDAGIPPANGFEVWVDEHYSDEFIAGRFENLVIEN